MKQIAKNALAEKKRLEAIVKETYEQRCGKHYWAYNRADLELRTVNRILGVADTHKPTKN